MDNNPFKDAEHDDYDEYPDDQLDNSVNPPPEEFLKDEEDHANVAP